jgi:hypothetical protein
MADQDRRDRFNLGFSNVNLLLFQWGTIGVLAADFDGLCGGEAMSGHPFSSPFSRGTRTEEVFSGRLDISIAVKSQAEAGL